MGMGRKIYSGPGGAFAVGSRIVEGGGKRYYIRQVDMATRSFAEVDYRLPNTPRPYGSFSYRAAHEFAAMLAQRVEEEDNENE